jgi:predicted metal-binding protein
MSQGYKAHLFICTNKKDGKECCAEKRSENLRKAVKDLAKQKWGKDVRINSAGCLDHCSEGIAAVLYPQGEWFTHLKDTSEDANALIEAIAAVFDPES